MQYSSPDGPVPAYFAAPPGDGPWPGVVVVHDALGMTGDLRRITDRFAANGYLALAPALYRRGGRLRCVVSTMFSLSLCRGTALDALVAARDHLVADDRCTGKVGAVGFCMGGGFCIQAAPLGIFDATAPNYGVIPVNRPDLTDACPVVASYGARDWMLPGAAARLHDELTQAGIVHDVKEYEGVGHGFMNEWKTPSAVQFVERVAGLSYSRPEAEDAWMRILTFFKEHLADD
jgi:carboxymethylenebutenolidase